MEAQIQGIIKQIDEWKGKTVKYELLDKGLTNHNYKTYVNDDVFVLRIPGVGTDLFINRDHEINASTIAGKIGVAPEVVNHIEKGNITVTRFVDGTVLSPELVVRNDNRINHIIDTVKVIHEKAVFRIHFDPFVAIRTRLEYTKNYKTFLPKDIQWMISLSDDIENAMRRNKPRHVACHNDLNPENFIDDGKQLWIIDWEYAAQADPFFDLGNFRAETPLSRNQEELVIRRYCGAMKYNRLCRMLLYKIIADLCWGLWAMIQEKISRKDVDFHDYGLGRFESLRVSTHSKEFRKWIEEV